MTLLECQVILAQLALFELRIQTRRMINILRGRGHDFDSGFRFKPTAVKPLSKVGH